MLMGQNYLQPKKCGSKAVACKLYRVLYRPISGTYKRFLARGMHYAEGTSIFSAPSENPKSYFTIPEGMILPESAAVRTPVY